MLRVLVIFAVLTAAVFGTRTQVGPAVATGRPRLLKLHLMRPDLIGYPVPFEVYA